MLIPCDHKISLATFTIWKTILAHLDLPFYTPPIIGKKFIFNIHELQGYKYFRNIVHYNVFSQRKSVARKQWVIENRIPKNEWTRQVVYLLFLPLLCQQQQKRTDDKNGRLLLPHYSHAALGVLLFSVPDDIFFANYSHHHSLETRLTLYSNFFTYFKCFPPQFGEGGRLGSKFCF